MTICFVFLQNKFSEERDSNPTHLFAEMVFDDPEAAVLTPGRRGLGLPRWQLLCLGFTRFRPHCSKLKKPPKGYPVDFKEIELLKQQDFTVFKTFTETEITSADFDKEVIDVFATMKPLLDYLNKALEG